MLEMEQKTEIRPEIEDTAKIRPEINPQLDLFVKFHKNGKKKNGEQKYKKITLKRMEYTQKYNRELTRTGKKYKKILRDLNSKLRIIRKDPSKLTQEELPELYKLGLEHGKDKNKSATSIFCEKIFRDTCNHEHLVACEELYEILKRDPDILPEEPKFLMNLYNLGRQHGYELGKEAGYEIASRLQNLAEEQLDNSQKENTVVPVLNIQKEPSEVIYKFPIVLRFLLWVLTIFIFVKLCSFVYNGGELINNVTHEETWTNNYRE